MENKEPSNKASGNKKIALILGGVALAWYAIAMLTIWLR